MPYAHIEEIKNRTDEKIALFLTAENGMGLMAGALPTYILTQSLPFLVRVLLIVLAASIGVALTVKVGGLALYARLLWQLRGLVRRRVAGGRITPEQLAGGRVATAPTRALRVGGPVQLARIRPAHVHPALRPSTSTRQPTTPEA